MPRKPYPTDILDEAQGVMSAWVQIDEQMTFGPANIGALTMAFNQSRGVEASIIELEKKLVELRNQRDASHGTLWDLIKRVRAGVKAIYGDDSSQYEVIGGTPLSEKKAARKIVTPA
jgi:hypothetical protein